MFLRSYSFILSYPISWYIIFHNIFLQSFVFLWCWLLFLLFHFLLYLCKSCLCLCLYLSLSSPPLPPTQTPAGWVWLKVNQFCWSFQKAISWFCWSVVFSVSISFISALIFIISILLLVLDLVCSSFSISFRWKVRLFIWDFSCFLM